MPEETVALAEFYLGVRNRGAAVWAPVDNALAAVDQALIVKPYKNFFDRLGTAFVQREALAFPVARGTQLLQLLNNPSAVFLLPLPRALQKSVAADILFGKALLAHRLDNLRLCRNGGMIGSRQPQRRISLHPSPADQNILQGLVQSVSHMELTGDVRGRNDNGIWLLLWIRFGVEITTGQPEVINSVLHFLWVISFCKFPAHTFSS